MQQKQYRFYPIPLLVPENANVSIHAGQESQG